MNHAGGSCRPSRLSAMLYYQNGWAKIPTWSNFEGKFSMAYPVLLERSERSLKPLQVILDRARLLVNHVREILSDNSVVGNVVEHLMFTDTPNWPPKNDTNTNHNP